MSTGFWPSFRSEIFPTLSFHASFAASTTSAPTASSASLRAAHLIPFGKDIYGTLPKRYVHPVRPENEPADNNLNWTNQP
jgi:hypothetical protein